MQFAAKKGRPCELVLIDLNANPKVKARRAQCGAEPSALKALDSSAALPLRPLWPRLAPRGMLRDASRAVARVRSVIRTGPPVQLVQYLAKEKAQQALIESKTPKTTKKASQAARCRLLPLALDFVPPEKFQSFDGVRRAEAGGTSAVCALWSGGWCRSGLIRRRFRRQRSASQPMRSRQKSQRLPRRRSPAFSPGRVGRGTVGY